MVFTSLEDLAARIDDPELDITDKDIMVLQNAGPNSTSAMPEAGYLPIPKKLATAGVKDMIRVSDARMSGTAFGTIVLHVTPDAAASGPLALVRTGDRIKLSVKSRTIDLLVDEAELKKRAADVEGQAPGPRPRLRQALRRANSRCRSGLRFRVPSPALTPHFCLRRAASVYAARSPNGRLTKPASRELTCVMFSLFTVAGGVQSPPAGAKSCSICRARSKAIRGKLRLPPRCSARRSLAHGE